MNPDRDLPQPGDVRLRGVDRPQKFGIFVKGNVVLATERYDAGGDFGELGLTKLGCLSLLMDFQGSVRAHAHQPADDRKRHQKNAQRHQHFQKRQPASPTAGVPR